MGYYSIVVWGYTEILQTGTTEAVVYCTKQQKYFHRGSKREK